MKHLIQIFPDKFAEIAGTNNKLACIALAQVTTTAIHDILKEYDETTTIETLVVNGFKMDILVKVNKDINYNTMNMILTVFPQAVVISNKTAEQAFTVEDNIYSYVPMKPRTMTDPHFCIECGQIAQPDCPNH